MSRKNVILSLKDRIQLIRDSETISTIELSKKFGCSQSTVYRIIRDKYKIMRLSTENILSVKRNKTGGNQRVEHALKVWYDQMCAAGKNITKNSLLEKAEQLSKQFNIHFKPTSKWLLKWQQLEGIHIYKERSNHRSIDSEINDLTTMFDESNIFSVGSSLLYYKAIPSAEMPVEIGNAKTARHYMSVVFVCNATGDYKKVYAIGKSMHPHCFKNKTIPVTYYSNARVCLSNEILSDILSSIDKEMIKSKRKILILLESDKVFRIVSSLQNIELRYITPDKDTSNGQPLNGAIIPSFKNFYKDYLIENLTKAMNSGSTYSEYLKAIDMRRALHLIYECWLFVQSTYILNSFRNAGLVPIDEKNKSEVRTDIDALAEEPYVEVNQMFVTCDNLKTEIISPEDSNDTTDTAMDTLENEDHPREDPISTDSLLSAICLLKSHFSSCQKYSHELDKMKDEIVLQAIEFKNF